MISAIQIAFRNAGVVLEYDDIDGDGAHVVDGWTVRPIG